MDDQFQVYCRINDLNWDVHEFIGEERLSTSYRFNVTIIVPQETHCAWLHQAAQLFWQAVDSQARYFNAHINCICYARPYDDYHCLYRVELVTKFHQLTQRFENKLWIDTTTCDILQQLLSECGYQADEVMALNTPTVQQQLMQYDSTSVWDFILYLCSGELWFFWLVNDSHHEKLIFNNNPLQQPTRQLANLTHQPGLVDFEHYVQCDSEGIILCRDRGDDYPGLCLEEVETQKRYLITAIKHVYRRADSQHSRAYQCVIQCENTVTNLNINAELTLNPYQLGTIEANQNPPCDAQGRYQTKLTCLNQPYPRYPYYTSAAIDNRWYRELPAYSDVVVGIDASMQLILGNINRTEPLVTANNTQNLIYRDLPFNLTFNEAQVTLGCDQEIIQLSQDVRLNTSGHFQQQHAALRYRINGYSQENYQQQTITAKHYAASSRYGSIQYQCQQLTQRYQDMRARAKQQQIIAEHLTWQGESWQLVANLNAHSKDLQWHSQKSCILNAQRIKIGDQQAGFQLDSQGDLKIWGQAIAIDASQVDIKANINVQNTSAKIPTSAQQLRDRLTVPPHWQTQEVMDLRWSSTEIDRTADVQIQFRLKTYPQSLTVKIYLCRVLATSVSYHSNQVERHEQRRCIEEFELALGTLNYRQAWRLKSEPQSQSLTFFRFSVVVNGSESYALSPPLQVLGELIVQFNEDYFVTHKTPLIVYYKTLSLGWFNQVKVIETSKRSYRYDHGYVLSHLPLGTDYRLHILGHEIVTQDIHCFYDMWVDYKAIQTITLTLNNPPAIVNSRVPVLVTDACIRYFQQHQGTVTLFIHGYNVALGAFGCYAYDSKHGYWRCRQSISHQNPALVQALATTRWAKEAKAASGSYAWLLQMEHNLNRACGNHTAEDYKRIMLFTWPGDEAKAWDFIAARRTAREAAAQLQRVLLQLHSAGLKINVIAHSLGAGVLIQAMQLLAEQGQEQLIDQAVFWQAAIPNTSLCPITVDNQSSVAQGFHHDTSHVAAHRAAKQLLVLYSRQDNILGPVMPNSAPAQAKPAIERYAATLMSRLHLGSLYEIAVWLGVSPQQLLSHANRERFYRAWVQQHECDKAGVAFPASLATAVQRYHPNHRELPILSPLIKVEKQLYHWGVQSAVTDHPRQKLAYQAARFSQRRLYIEVISFNQEIKTLYLVLRHTGYHPTPALGWSGPDRKTRRCLAGKLTVVDQSAVLLHHSAMFEPSTALYQKIFKAVLAKQIEL
jgi:Phage tail baseplate hub (GPD)/Alpha/beta hydrolase of unknown function (DUF900)